MVRTKVFVGNLSFKVTDTELSTQFAAAGNVVSANIITRGPRSLGYGFVEMQSDEEAQKAIETLNKKEIEGREINVELAKIREDGEQAPEKRPKAPRKRNRKPRGPKKSDGEEVETKEGEKKEAPKKAAPKKEAADNEGESAPRRPRKPRRARKPAAAKEEAQPAKGETEAKPKRVRKRKPRVASDVERTPSKTTLFVANLPFVLTDETFGNVLKESDLAFKQAHVVKKYNGRSKGYGFIEFNAEEDQVKALEALNKKVVETRELSVKIAFTELKVPEVEKSEGKEETKTEKKEGEPEKKETAPVTPVVTPVATETTPAAEQK